MEGVKFRGYHEVNGLPFRRGQSVVVPVSTQVDSTNPKRRKFKIRRRQTVRVDHVGCGRSFCIGHVYGDSQRVGSLIDRGDIEILQDRYGTSDLDTLVHHRDVVVKGRDIFIPIDNPTIVWAGSGGYWCEVDLNDLLEANGIRPTPVLEKYDPGTQTGGVR